MRYFVLFTFLACTLIARSEAKRAVQIDDIREATFRYQFTKNASRQQTTAKIYFLSFPNPEKQERHDPSDDFMKRFADHKPRVARVSQAKTSIDDVVRDSKTGEQGMIFSVYAIRWKSDTEVEVAGGYYECGESASSNTYYLVKEDGKWRVVRDVLHTISQNAVGRELTPPHARPEQSYNAAAPVRDQAA